MLTARCFNAESIAAIFPAALHLASAFVVMRSGALLIWCLESETEAHAMTQNCSMALFYNPPSHLHTFILVDMARLGKPTRTGVALTENKARLQRTHQRKQKQLRARLECYKESLSCCVERRRTWRTPPPPRDPNKCTRFNQGMQSLKLLLKLHICDLDFFFSRKDLCLRQKNK